MATISAPDALLGAAVRLQENIRGLLGLGAGALTSDSADIRFVIDAALATEEYLLHVDTTGVRISASTVRGALHAGQTLLQLLPPEVYRRATASASRAWLPAVDIHDAPRFDWRGVMLDTVRHFTPTREILRLIDLMSVHKLNVLHLHLTDDQGWRIEITKYPRLTEVGAWRTESQVGAGPTSVFDGRPHGGYYTQADLREIVAYAAERGIEVIPEIETPGHVRAALAAYPELGVTGDPVSVWTEWGVSDDVLNLDESTIQFFCDVLHEVVDIFPSPYIGIGGDECPDTQWLASEATRARMRELGLASTAQARAWFASRLGEFLRSRGRRVFAWDEILDGTPPEGAAVASWRGLHGATTAALRGINVVSCPDDFVYLDYRQSDSPDEPIPVSIPLTLERALSFDPVPAGLPPHLEPLILGGQAQLWTEHIDNPRALDYQAFPRLCAIATALWASTSEQKELFWDGFDVHLQRLDALGVEYRPATGPRPWERRPGVPGRPETPAERAAHIEQLVSPTAIAHAPVTTNRLAVLTSTVVDSVDGSRSVDAEAGSV